MLTGKRFWTLAMVLGLCVLATAGCRRKSRSGTTINSSSIFTTDSFPGAPVQDGNVSDDKRAMSNSGEDYNNDILCTANGDRGTMMLTYTTDQGLYAHYYDGSLWTPPVALRAADADTSSVDGSRVIHAFVNTANHSDSSAQNRDGDCLIFWVAFDFDNDPTTTPDEVNECLWMTYFDVSHVSESLANYGFDNDPSVTPGIHYAERVNGSYDDSGEDMGAIGLVTNGLCGEARWYDGFADYSYGNETTNIYVFWHQTDEKVAGVFDETTAFAFIDLDAVADPEFPLVSVSGGELFPQTFGAVDGGADAAVDSQVENEYISYNNVLFRRVLTDFDNTDGGFDDTNSFVGTDDDCTIQESHFDLISGLIVTDNINTVDADSSTLNTTEQNANWLENSVCVYGSDEGLSCIVIYFVEIVDGDLDTDIGELTYDVSLCLAEIDEFGSGGFLNDVENQFIDFEDSLITDNVDEYNTLTEMSRNGDYIWVAFEDENNDGIFVDTGLWASQYLTTRLDGSGLPVAIPALTVTKGVPIAVNADRDGVDINWFMFQDNLGYICGHQSDAQEMNLFYETYTTTFTEDNIDRVRLVADVDGAVGSEAAFITTIVVEDDESIHDVGFEDDGRSTFNATDAGSDGDIFMVVATEDSSSYFTDLHLYASRIGVVSAGPLEIDSVRTERQIEWDNYPLFLVATPAGSDIGAFDVSSSQYEGGAHFGPTHIHVFFREAESMTAWQDFAGTNTGYAFRTRVYQTNSSTATFGEDFVPNAGGGLLFALPFDIDVPFVDPDTNDDAENFEFAVCDDTVGVWFTELRHIYYQECDPGNSSNGWRTVDEINGDPALVDDDNEIQLDDEEIDHFCVHACTCCTLDGATVFWHKELDDDAGDERLQTRTHNGDSNR